MGGPSWLGLSGHARWLDAEADRLLTFGAAARHPEGGFAWLGEDGTPDLDRPVELWVTCRLTHVFALGSLLGRPGCGPLADHGLEALRGRFADPVNGGWYAAVDASGPTVRDKTAYEHAFVMLAATSGVAAGRADAESLLRAALDVMIERFWDETHGMVVEHWDESFTALEDYRGVNANMHTVEALLAAADVLGDVSLRGKAARVLERVCDLARGQQWRIPEHFTPDWTPLLDYNRDEPAHPFRPYGATIGHWLEWARLALHLRAQLIAAGETPPERLLADAVALFDAAVREGWAVDGAAGFVYTVDWDGTPVVRERMHWVAAEATATAYALHAATGEDGYATWYRTWWDYIATHLRDEGPGGGGSWHHELSPSNGPSSMTWSGKPDTYHAFQATLIPRLPLAPTIAAALRDGVDPTS